MTSIRRSECLCGRCSSSFPIASISSLQPASHRLHLRSQPAPGASPRANPPSAEPAKLDSAPRLTMPNRETLVADLSMAAAPLASNPQLPRPAATSLPLRVFEQKPNQEVTQNSSIDPFTGQPVHVLAVSPNPA